MSTEGQEARDASSRQQAKIVKQWKNFAVGSALAYQDLIGYIDNNMAMYTKYCEDMSMPHPTKPGEVIPLSNDMIASLLQARRGCGMVKAYIQSRVDEDVAQST